MITSYTEFINQYQITDNIIPKYIYKTCVFDFINIPQPIIDAFNKSLEFAPNYKIVYFSDNDISEFIKEYFPEYFEAYDNVVPGAYRADIFRLLVLYKFGGIYSDVCHIFVSDINNIIGSDNDLVFVGTHTPAIFNAFIASKPQNRIIKYLLEKVMYNVSNCFYNDNLLDITGPEALGKAFIEYSERMPHTMFNIGCFYTDNYKILSHILVIEYDDIINNGYICNNLGEKLIKAKFPEYYPIMGLLNPPYKYFYDNNIVYKKTLIQMSKNQFSKNQMGHLLVS